MSLQDWLRNDWLVEHKTSREEAQNLLALADRDLIDSQIPALSPDWRFNIAYNAALQAATAALAVAPVFAPRGRRTTTGSSSLSPIPSRPTPS